MDTARTAAHHRAVTRPGALAALALLAALVPLATVSTAPEPVVASGAQGVTARYVPITPIRVVDSRQGIGTTLMSPGQTAEVTLVTPEVRKAVGAGEITGVVVNLTVVEASRPGFLTLWGSGSRPDTSSLNADEAGQTVANLATTPVSASGTAQVFSDAGGHVLIDVQGVYLAAPEATAGRLVALDRPYRLLDTRDEADDGSGGTTGGRLEAGRTRSVDLGPAGVPADASGVVLNLTATGGTEAGFLTVWPHGQPRPEASNLNVGSGAFATVANQVFAAVGGSRVSVYTSTTTDMIIDVAGYFTGADAANSADGLFVAVSPRRLLDTRQAGGITGQQRMVSGVPLDIGVLGQAGLPAAGISAVALNTTLTQTAAAGWAVNYPAGQSRPSTSSVNSVGPDHTVANHVTTAITSDGVTVYADIDTHVLVDLTGYWTGITPAPPDPAQPPPSEPPTRGSHSFLYTSGGTQPPARWDPCTPIRYRVNGQLANPVQRQIMQQAIVAAQRETGIPMVYVGETTEGYGRTVPSDVDAVFVFTDSERSPFLTGFTIGVGGGRYWYTASGQGVVRQGYALVHVGTGNDWLHQAVWKHEIAHMLGLGHVWDEAELMYPAALGLSTYQNGDREGLWHMGAAQGCLRTPVADRLEQRMIERRTDPAPDDLIETFVIDTVDGIGATRHDHGHEHELELAD